MSGGFSARPGSGGRRGLLLATSCERRGPLCQQVDVGRLDDLYADFQKRGFSPAWSVARTSRPVSPAENHTWLQIRWAGSQCEVEEGLDRVVTPARKQDFEALRKVMLQTLDEAQAASRPTP
jgi:hypothetical protein